MNLSQAIEQAGEKGDLSSTTITNLRQWLETEELPKWTRDSLTELIEWRTAANPIPIQPRSGVYPLPVEIFRNIPGHHSIAGVVEHPNGLRLNLQ